MFVHFCYLTLFLLGLNPEFKTVKLVDCDSGKSIAFASIDFLSDDSGTYSDEAGYFSIPMNSDSIRISALGYSPKIILRSDWESLNQGTISICLSPMVYEFEHVTVEAKKLELKTLGYDLVPMPLNRIRYASWTGFGSVVAIQLNFPDRYKTNYIQELSIAVYENPFDSTLFRFRVMSVNEQSEPDSTLFESSLIRVNDKTQRWISFNFEDAWIPIREKSAFFVVETFVPKQDLDGFFAPKFSYLFHSRKKPKSAVLISKQGFHKWDYSRKQVVYRVKYYGEE